MLLDSICLLLYCVGFSITSIAMMSIKAFASPQFGKVSLIYPTLTNPYFLKRVDELNNTVIDLITDKVGEINQDYVAFGYFLLFAFVTYTRAFIVTCMCCVRWCSPDTWSNPDKESAKISPSEKDMIKLESDSLKAQERDFFGRYTSFMNIWRPLYRPVLMLLMCVLCGVTDPFIVAKVVTISFATELLLIFLQPTVAILLTYWSIYLGFWLLFGYASLRFPNKIMVVTSGIGLLETTVHTFFGKSETQCKKTCLYIRWMDGLAEIVFHFILLITCYLGYFY